MITIEQPKVSLDGDEVTYSTQICTNGKSDTLWYKLNKEFAALISDHADTALVGLLMPAMLQNTDIVIDGVISEKLHHSLKRVMKVLENLKPSLKKVNVTANNLSSERYSQSEGVITGFSGGVDSFSVLADHHYAPQRGALKLTHLLFNNVGSHGGGGETLFLKRYKQLQPAAKRIGMPYLQVNSNLSNFYQKELRFLHTHTMRNASVALLLQSGIAKFLYASTYDYGKIAIKPNRDIASSDPILLPLLSTESLELLSVGSEYNRVEKTIMLPDIDETYSSLDVCVNSKHNGPYHNCATCWKCMRTLATFEIQGVLDQYNEIFDLDAYQKARESYLSDLPNKKESLAQEVVEFAKTMNSPLPTSQHSKQTNFFKRCSKLFR